jgi:carbonic anhydrase
LKGGEEMEARICIFLSAVAFLLANAVTLASESGPGINPDEALKKLLDGNRNYVSNQMTINESSSPAKRQALTSAQHPFAVILCCSDSRVPPEIIFDKGLGEIFVVRVAGNVTNPIIIGSIEYALEHLGSSLIMVLGHSRCGAVTAAVDAAGHQSGNIGAIIEAIGPAVQLARKETKENNKSDLVEAAIDFNIKLAARSLLEQSPVIRSFVDSGKIKIVTAKYHLDDGKVSLLSN